MPDSDTLKPFPEQPKKPEPTLRAFSNTRRFIGPILKR
jgi:hypothetical protein